MQARTPVVVVLTDGEPLHGTIEWYDRDCIKLTRNGSPNLLIYKQFIKYVYKDGEEAALGGYQRAVILQYHAGSILDTLSPELNPEMASLDQLFLRQRCRLISIAFRMTSRINRIAPLSFPPNHVSPRR